MVKLHALMECFDLGCSGGWRFDRPVRHGFSGAQIWRAVVAEPPGSGPEGRQFCIRKWPTGTPQQRIAEIHKVIDAIGYGQPLLTRTLAIPLRTAAGSSLVKLDDSIYEMARWLPGQSDFHTNPSQARLTSIMTWLAEFHRVSAGTCRATNGLPLGLQSRIRRIDELLSGQADRIASGVRSTRSVDLHPFQTRVALPLLERFRREARGIRNLLESSSARSVPLPFCLRDIWHDHILFEGDEVTGVVDYDALRRDSVAADLARLLRSLLENDADRWNQALEIYAGAAQPVFDLRSQVHRYDSANCLLSGIQWLEWIYVKQLEFPDRQRVLDRVSMWLAQRPILIE